MDDFFVLEDNLVRWEYISQILPPNLTYTHAPNGTEFEAYLAQGRTAKIYFLDDEVPDSQGIVGYHFIKHCNILLDQQPTAKVFYTGSAPGPEETDFCEERMILMIDKNHIGKKVQELLTR